MTVGSSIFEKQRHWTVLQGIIWQIQLH